MSKKKNNARFTPIGSQKTDLLQQICMSGWTEYNLKHFLRKLLFKQKGDQMNSKQMLKSASCCGTFSHSIFFFLFAIRGLIALGLHPPFWTKLLDNNLDKVHRWDKFLRKVLYTGLV